MSTVLSTDCRAYGAEPLELEILMGLCLVADGLDLPLTTDGRLAREAFGRDVDLTVLARRANGVQVRETRNTALLDADGAPTALPYGALVVLGLAVDTDAPCGWAPTAAGRALVAHA